MSGRNWLTFDGVSLKDYGVYINGNGTFNAPARNREMINVPGRNGALMIDNGRYENTDVVYHAFIYDNFSANIEGLRNLLLSRTSYKTLKDTYHPEEYRLGIYKGDFQADVVEWLQAGEFDLTFDCKPQRFLESGEETSEFTVNGVILNPTMQTAKPLLRVYGTGQFSINSRQMTISSANVYTDIDCDLMDAFKGSTNCNGNISGQFAELVPGENTVTIISGITKIEVVPRWWVL